MLPGALSAVLCSSSHLKFVTCVRGMSHPPKGHRSALLLQYCFDTFFSFFLFLSLFYLTLFRCCCSQPGGSAAAQPPLVALLAGEVGGGNGIEPLSVGSRLGLPVVDGDLMGRAFPELQVSQGSESSKCVSHHD